jgi:pimeloyl-ACP methyl ester carboxylesterase
MVFVLVHGAFVGAWSWDRVAPLLRAAGHTVWTPTLSGVGERCHELRRDISLETHIEDVANLLSEEDLQEVILVGHSYAGLVITGVAERAAERIRKLVYLDAVIPNDGDSFFSIAGAKLERRIRETACLKGGGWRVPPVWTAESLGLTDPDDCTLFNTRTTPQSLSTYEQGLALTSHAAERLERSYIFCSADLTSPFFLPFFKRAKAEGWYCRELPTSHLPMFTMPGDLANALLDVTVESIRTAIPFSF